MITDDERFIEIQVILAFSDISITNCTNINDLIIELSEENQLLKETIDKAKNQIDKFNKEEGLSMYTDTWKHLKPILEILEDKEV